MTPGKPQHTDPSPYQQRSLWEAPQWEPIPEPEEPWLPPWRHALRTVLGARVLTLALLTAAMLLGSSYARGVPADSALAARTTPRPQARAVGKLPADEPMSAPPATPAPSPTLSASPAPTRTATDAPTRTPTIAPSATSTATAPPSATPTEDTSLEVTAPTATSATGSAPAPTVVYPIGPPPVRLVIPSIGVDIPVITVGTVKHTAGGQTYEVWDTVADAGAYHKMSAPPGYVGNTVINGHRDILGKVFADLDKVQVGDPITLFTENHEFTYTVSEVLVVPEKHASPEQRAENQRLIGYIPEDRLTLVTCTPYGTNLNRLLVIARPAGQPQN